MQRAVQSLFDPPPQEFHMAGSEVMQLRDNLPPIEEQPQAVKHFADIAAAVLMLQEGLCRRGGSQG